MTQLYEALEPKEGEPAQYLGVYITKWRPEWGQPTIMFREVEEPEPETMNLQEAIDELHEIIEGVQLTDNTPREAAAAQAELEVQIEALLTKVVKAKYDTVDYHLVHYQELIEAADDGDWHNSDDCKAEGRSDSCRLCKAIALACGLLEKDTAQ